MPSSPIKAVVGAVSSRSEAGLLGEVRRERLGKLILQLQLKPEKRGLGTAGCEKVSTVYRCLRWSSRQLNREAVTSEGQAEKVRAENLDEGFWRWLSSITDLQILQGRNVCGSSGNNPCPVSNKTTESVDFLHKLKDFEYF